MLFRGEKQKGHSKQYYYCIEDASAFVYTTDQEATENSTLDTTFTEQWPISAERILDSVCSRSKTVKTEYYIALNICIA